MAQSFKGEIWTNATQWKIVGRIVQLYFIFGTLIGLCAFALFLRSRPRLDQVEAVDLVPLEGALQNFNFELLLWFGGFGFIYIGLFSLVALAEFQRVIAPVEKIEVILRRASESDHLPDRLRFRKSDAFPELERQFNSFIEMLKERQL